MSNDRQKKYGPGHFPLTTEICAINDEKILAAKPKARKLFWSKVRKTSECWLFEGTMTTYGYGKYSHNRTSTTAHRVAKLWRTGKPQPLMQACHKCSNRACVRPAHIYWGTRAENIADIVRDGNLHFQRTHSEDNYFTKLTNEIVIRIWGDLIINQSRLTELAKKYNTTNQIIYQIKIGQSWKKVTATLPPLPRIPKAGDYPKIKRKRLQPMTSQQIEQICQMIDDGVTLRAVAKAAKSCDSTLRNVYSRHRGHYPVVRGAVVKKRKPGRKAPAHWIKFLNQEAGETSLSS